MTINVSVPTNEKLKPRITVIGVGGAGCNAVDNMIEAKLDGVEFLVANTDAQSLANSLSERKVQLGEELTKGLGAGAKPEIGRQAADESLSNVLEHLDGTHMLFVTAGMGGGTGTGAAPVIAEAARERGILTVGVVTKPFEYEGIRRMNIADKGIEELTQSVDTLIIIPNQNLFRIANKDTTFTEAFRMADDVLYNGVKGVTDLIVKQGRINLDFADIKTVMMEMGKAMMGTGEAEGEDRAITAAETAISNPLLDDTSIANAKGVIVNISGGEDMKIYEVDEIAAYIKKQCKEDVNLIIGHTIEENDNGALRVSVLASGIGVNDNIDENDLDNKSDNNLNIKIKPRLVSGNKDNDIIGINTRNSIKPKLVSKQADLEDFLSDDDDLNIIEEDKELQESTKKDKNIELNDFIPNQVVNPEVEKKEEPNPFDEADMLNVSKSESNSLIARLSNVRDKAINVRNKAISLVNEVTTINKTGESNKNTNANGSEKIEPSFISNNIDNQHEPVLSNTIENNLIKNGLDETNANTESYMEIPAFLRRQRD